MGESTQITVTTQDEALGKLLLTKNETGETIDFKIDGHTVKAVVFKAALTKNMGLKASGTYVTNGRQWSATVIAVPTPEQLQKLIAQAQGNGIIMPSTPQLVS